VKNRARIAASFLSLLILMQTACNKDTDAPVSDTQTDTAQAENCSIPDIDWDGREFNVLGYGKENFNDMMIQNFEIFAEAETGIGVNDAVYRRNKNIEEMYNVKITQTLNDDNGYFFDPEHIRLISHAQENKFDLVFCGIQTIGLLAREGFFYDLNKVDYMDFTKNYWYPEANKLLSYNNQLFFSQVIFHFVIKII
jgi:hypothetical protein